MKWLLPLLIVTAGCRGFIGTDEVRVEVVDQFRAPVDGVDVIVTDRGLELSRATTVDGVAIVRSAAASMISAIPPERDFVTSYMGATKGGSLTIYLPRLPDPIPTPTSLHVEILGLSTSFSTVSAAINWWGMCSESNSVSGSETTTLELPVVWQCDQFSDYQVTAHLQNGSDRSFAVTTVPRGASEAVLELEPATIDPIDVHVRGVPEGSTSFSLYGHSLLNDRPIGESWPPLDGPPDLEGASTWDGQHFISELSRADVASLQFGFQIGSARASGWVAVPGSQSAELDFDEMPFVPGSVAVSDRRISWVTGDGKSPSFTFVQAQGPELRWVLVYELGSNDVVLPQLDELDPAVLDQARVTSVSGNVHGPVDLQQFARPSYPHPPQYRVAGGEYFSIIPGF